MVTQHTQCAGPLLGQRRRRWPNRGPAHCGNEYIWEGVSRPDGTITGRSIWQTSWMLTGHINRVIMFPGVLVQGIIYSVRSTGTTPQLEEWFPGSRTDLYGAFRDSTVRSESLQVHKRIIYNARSSPTTRTPIVVCMDLVVIQYTPYLRNLCRDPQDVSIDMRTEPRSAGTPGVYHRSGLASLSLLATSG